MKNNNNNQNVAPGYTIKVVTINEKFGLYYTYDFGYYLPVYSGIKAENNTIKYLASDAKMKVDKEGKCVLYIYNNEN